MTEPSAATSATAEPEISAKNSDTPTFTIASPPRTKPISAETKSISRCVMPEAFMMAPASTNIGIAMSENLVAPLYMSSATVTSAPVPSAATMPITPEIASATAIGTLMKIMNRRARKMTRTIMPDLPR